MMQDEDILGRKLLNIEPMNLSSEDEKAFQEELC